MSADPREVRRLLRRHLIRHHHARRRWSWWLLLRMTLEELNVIHSVEHTIPDSRINHAPEDLSDGAAG